MFSGGQGGCGAGQVRLVADLSGRVGQRLDPGVEPVVFVLLNVWDLELERVDDLREQMGAMGYVLARDRLLCESMELCFFGDPEPVLRISPSDEDETVAWLASTSLWRSGVPFEWTVETGCSLHVPGAYAEVARSALLEEPVTSGRVVHSDGSHGL